MTTKMIATRGDGVMPCFVVLLLMLGVPSAQTQCAQKVTKCVTLLTNIDTQLAPLVTPPSNATALETKCSTVRQNATDCVWDASASCIGRPDMLGILANSSTSFDSSCGPALICLLNATACEAAMLVVMPPSPPPWDESETTANVENLQKLCPLYQQTSQCLRDLTATDDCGEMEELKNLTSAVAMAAPTCPGGKWCPQSFVCISAFLHGVEAGGECTSLPTYVRCLNDLNGTCTFNESKITLTDLQSLMTSTCTEMAKYPAEYQNCSALGQCGENSPTVGQLTRVSDESVSAMEALFTIATLLNDPAFLCSYVQVMVDCAVSQAGTCGYSDQYVIAMTAQQQSIHSKCPNAGSNAGQNTAPEVRRNTQSGGERSSGHALHWVLTAVTSVTAALQFGL